MVSFVPLTGHLFVSRDPEETSKVLIAVDERGRKKTVTIFFPDDMASANINSWAASDRLRCSGICHMHSPSGGWDEVDLTGKHVYFEKWSERAFEYNGRTFYVLSERSVTAYTEEGEEDDVSGDYDRDAPPTR